jgi:hypothetical protein
VVQSIQPNNVVYVRVTNKDCIMGPAGQTRQGSGSCRFWAWVVRGKGAYLSSPDLAKFAMADWCVNEWLANEGRFLRRDKERRAFYVVGSMYASAMVKYFMSGTWIVVPRDTRDYLFGKGGKTINHPGSNLFRGMMQAGKETYNSLPSRQRRSFALACAKRWSNMGGRFLQRDETIGLWHEADEDAVCGMVQTFMIRREPLQVAPALKQEPAPPENVEPGHPIEDCTAKPCPPSSFELAPFPAFTSCRFKASFDTAPSSDWSESCRGEATEGAVLESTLQPPPKEKKKGQMAALARWTTNLLAPLRRIFRRGRS